MVTSSKTAIKRTRMSAPMGYLLNADKLVHLGLDYGCGLGFDAEVIGYDRYDPCYFPSKPAGKKYRVVTCHYVLNVLPEEKRMMVINEILNFLDYGGTAYITVRRDIKIEGETTKGYQFNVFLQNPWKILVENSKFCIYQYTK